MDLSKRPGTRSSVVWACPDRARRDLFVPATAFFAPVWHAARALLTTRQNVTAAVSGGPQRGCPVQVEECGGMFDPAPGRERVGRYAPPANRYAGRENTANVIALFGDHRLAGSGPSEGPRGPAPYKLSTRPLGAFTQR